MMSTEIVMAILEELRSRKGFDWWWNDLDEGIQREIREELMVIVDRKLDGH